MKLERTHRQAIVAVAKTAGIPPERITAMIAIAEGNLPRSEVRPALLTQAQKARQLGVSRFTIRKLVAAGRLRPIELLPGLVRYRATDLVEDY